MSRPVPPLPKELPRCWVDENNVMVYRNDVSLAEARELGAIMSQAFNAGLLSAAKQLRDARNSPRPKDAD